MIAQMWRSFEEFPASSSSFEHFSFNPVTFQFETEACILKSFPSPAAAGSLRTSAGGSDAAKTPQLET